MHCYLGGIGPGHIPSSRILRFNSTAEKWEDVGEFNRHGYAMQAGFSDLNILCRNQHKLSYFLMIH